jgi:hypothetical protein
MGPVSSGKSAVNSIKKCIGGVVDLLSPPHRRISWGSHLATVSGFDRLKIGLFVQFRSESFMDSLDMGKAQAKEQNEQVPVSFSPHGDQVYMCHATGRKGGYAYHLSRGDVHIFVSRRKDFTTPNVWVDIGSESCWAPSYQSVLDEIKHLLTIQGGEILKDMISEVHLCTDVIGQDIEELPIDNGRFWITKASKFGSFFDREHLEGIQLMQVDGDLPASDTYAIKEGVQIGKGDIVLRLYDKRLELKQNKSKQSLFASVWNQAEYDEQPVTRCEFQLRRNVLKQMNIHSLQDLEENKAGLWRYCCQDWARLSHFDVDRKNRHQDRALLHPFWEFIQEADWSAPPCPVVRSHKRATKDWEAMADMLAAYGMNVGVLLNRSYDDLEGTIAFAQGAIDSAMRRLWKRRETKDGLNEFQKRMKKRWVEIWPMGFQPAPV